MRTVPLQELLESPELLDEVASILKDDGLVCFPTRRQYGIAASLYSEQAVMSLVQSKRRAGKAPSLVLIPSRSALKKGLVEDIPAAAYPLMDTFWPGALTLLFRPGPELPNKVLRTLGAHKDGRLGVRLCSGEPSLAIVRAFGGPVLITSANLAKKVGSTSPAQIRKNFNHTVDLLVDAGDLPAAEPSTVVDPELGFPAMVHRAGVISADEVEKALRVAGMSSLITG